jgi:carbonic anhydrase/acetyltransferase-like protein (isoleucine patch superfamily)
VLPPSPAVYDDQARPACLEDWRPMHVEHRGTRPTVHASAWVAPTAVLVGDVHIGAESRVLWNAVLTAEDGRIELGERCVVMEHALVRARAAHPVTVGDDVLIGPHAHVNGAELGDGAFIATGASLFPGAAVGAEGAVAIRAVVHVMTRLPAGARVPIGWVAVGDPADLLPPTEVDEIRRRIAEVDFFRTVYGVPREAGATERMRRQAAWLGAHRADRVV